MATASTMNPLAEALGMSLPGCAAIPAPYKERAQIAYETGVRAVEMVHEDLKPSDILTREAFENTIAACSAIGGSTQPPIPNNPTSPPPRGKVAIPGWGKICYDAALPGQQRPTRKKTRAEYQCARG